jgi:hypothetical protein
METSDELYVEFWLLAWIVTFDEEWDGGGDGRRGTGTNGRMVSEGS